MLAVMSLSPVSRQPYRVQSGKLYRLALYLSTSEHVVYRLRRGPSKPNETNMLQPLHLAAAILLATTCAHAQIHSPQEQIKKKQSPKTSSGSGSTPPGHSPKATKTPSSATRASSLSSSATSPPPKPSGATQEDATHHPRRHRETFLAVPGKVLADEQPLPHHHRLRPPLLPRPRPPLGRPQRPPHAPSSSSPPSTGPPRAAPPTTPPPPTPSGSSPTSR